jgi:hypothetical protein
MPPDLKPCGLHGLVGFDMGPEMDLQTSHPIRHLRRIGFEPTQIYQCAGSLEISNFHRASISEIVFRRRFPGVRRPDAAFFLECGGLAPVSLL